MEPTVKFSVVLCNRISGCALRCEKPAAINYVFLNLKLERINLPIFFLQATDKEQEFAAAAAKQLEYQQCEDDKLSQKSSSSKLSRSPLKIVKKTKSMQCKIILLDGSEYGCEVEVKHCTGREEGGGGA